MPYLPARSTVSCWSSCRHPACAEGGRTCRSFDTCTILCSSNGNTRFHSCELPLCPQRGAHLESWQRARHRCPNVQTQWLPLLQRLLSPTQQHASRAAKSAVRRQRSRQHLSSQQGAQICRSPDTCTTPSSSSGSTRSRSWPRGCHAETQSLQKTAGSESWGADSMSLPSQSLGHVEAAAADFMSCNAASAGGVEDAAPDG